MRHKKVKFSVVLLLGLGLTGLHAQEAIPATGGNASGTGGSGSYTVGQVVYTTNSGVTGSVAQGVQQPYEISLVTGFKNAIGITLSLSVFPNPAADFVKLKVENYTSENLSFQLIDANGRNLESRKLEGIETAVKLNNLIPATYFLKVLDDNKEIKTFKIIKK